MMAASTLLSVRDLTISFQTEKGRFRATRDINLSVESGKTLALVGESGCGKSVTSLSLLKLLPENAVIESGQILFLEKNLLQADEAVMTKIRGNDIAMIFQEPMTALNPVYTVGQQVSEVFRIHKKLSRQEAFEKACQMLEKVKIPEPKRRMGEYPFQMSGGMRQRVLIAMALACNPKLLIADEPTTALDVTIQAQILRLMKELQEELGTAIIFITHDLGVVAEVADDVAVMYAGRIIEQASVYEIFKNPKHPYTHGLLQALPRLESSNKEKLSTIEGLVPSIEEKIKGCRFHNRCPFAQEKCRKIKPVLEAYQADHLVSCHRKEEGIL